MTSPLADARPQHPTNQLTADHAARLLRQALRADLQDAAEEMAAAAVDTGVAAGRLTVASARLAAGMAQRVLRPRRRPW